MVAFSDVLNLGMSLFGAVSSSKQMKKQNQLMEKQIDGMLEISDRQMDLSEQNQELFEDDFWYRREIEDLNRSLQEQEREWQLGELEYFREMLREDQDREIERQLEFDREAAAIKAWRLEQLDYARGMASQERTLALEMLDEAKAIAAGERDEELRRFYKDRATASSERDWRVGQYEQARRQAQEEREFDLNERAALTDRILGLDRSMASAMEQLGDPMSLYRATPEDIDREYARRSEEYQSDVDRAADRVASVGEADMVRSGIDVSTTGTDRRSEITRRIADSYQQARRRAYDDALAYIGGRQNTLNAPVSADMQRRAQVLGEVATSSGMPIELLMRRGSPRSELESFNLATLPGSAIIDRAISTANNYSAPIAIGSAMIDGTASMTPGISEYDIRTSLADPSYINIQSAIYGPYDQNVPNPAAFGRTAVSAGASALSARQGMWSGAMDSWNNSWAGLGKSASAFLDAIPRGVTTGPVGNNPRPIPRPSTIGSTYVDPVYGGGYP